MVKATFWFDVALHAFVAGTALFLGIWAAAGHGGSWVPLLIVIPLATLGASASDVYRSRLGRRMLGHERAARHAAEIRVAQLARHDALTGLLNRTVFLEHLDRALLGMRRRDRAIAVLCVDLSGFRAINQTLGHAAGDLLLRHAGARLLANLRETDVLARMGADEFAIIQTDLDGPQAAGSLCQRLLQAMAEPFDLYGHTTRVAVSIGVALAPHDADEAEWLLKQATIALHRAKEGGHPFCFFEHGMDTEMHRRRMLEQDLYQALEHGELELYYQPQYDIGTRRMIGVEALLRWHHPTRGLVGPDVFIPIAEDTGLILPIGAWVLDEACAQAARWYRAGAGDLRMAVNLSPVQFRDPDLAGVVAGSLERTGLDPRLLELEITERVLMENTAANLSTLGKLRNLGVRISMDDFGVGHSSLSYLQRFPFDEIKVDRSFVAGLGRDRSAAAIVRATLILGRHLGMDAVAEGVETAEQLAMLGDEGCRIAQGYFFSPPVTVAEIGAMVAAGSANAAVDALSEVTARTA